jgi:hypothetical protein
VNTISLARLNELAGRAIPYAKATGTQRSRWRAAMAGVTLAKLELTSMKRVARR